MLFLPNVRKLQPFSLEEGTAMNDFFNLKRFWLVLRRELCLSTKPLIIGTALTVAVLMFILLGVYKYSNYNIEAFMVLFGFLSVIATIAVWVSSAQISHNLARKTNFLAFSTLPASTFERYLARVVVCGFLPVAVWFTLYFGIHLFDRIVDYTEMNDRFQSSFIALSACVILFSTVFAFWGAAFRRYGFIIGFCVAAFSVFALFRWILPNINLMFLDPIGRFVQHDFFSYGRLRFVLAVALLVIGVVNLGAGYFFYRRKQMIVKPVKRQ